MSIVHEIEKYKDLIRELISKDLKLKYRRSFLGYLWSVLNPLGIMFVMVIVFTNMFRWDIPHYPVYLISGQMLFNYMGATTSHSMYSILDNGSLLKKIYVPKYIFTFSKVTSDLVDLLFNMGAMFLVIVVTRTPFSWYHLLIPFVILQLYVFCLGMGLFLAQASVFFRDIQYIYNVILTAWGYMTPIFYDEKMLPESLHFLVVRFNPMFSYIKQLRQITVEQTYPDLKLVAVGCIWAIVLLLFGSLVFKKNQSKFILYI